MTPSHLHWLAYLALASAVSLLLLTRSRSVPSLRPAARACLAFCAIDGMRLLLDMCRTGVALPTWTGWPDVVTRPLPQWASWVDVGLWVALSGPWAWLLVIPYEVRGHLHQGRARRTIVAEDQASEGAAKAVNRDDGRLSIVGARLSEFGERRRKVVENGGARLVAHAHMVAPLMGQVLTPILSYSALLLIFRRPLAPHWGTALQAPRLVTGAWALWVGMREGAKDEGLEEMASHPEPPTSATLSRSDALTGLPARVVDAVRVAPYHLPPSLAIGIALSLSAAASVVGGLWWDWSGVRVVSAAGWVVALGIGWREKSTGRPERGGLTSVDRAVKV